MKTDRANDLDTLVVLTTTLINAKMAGRDIVSYRILADIEDAIAAIAKRLKSQEVAK